ncbi:O-succinylbenzoic acid--CoA ligase [Haloactinopolyspora alba]|uniref:O-succinylbenzoic acid--CoA ligase n=1 Tax=Haloactinopolyspora alba TaxID=648780 RepID=A0A2P8DGN5_9ACTN|nr:o-succinylbenzoate--CoA ligase [Haloactinopolyspora alba]PSK96368.1 O-succinylbenzoic acid--CoA ligase [Haloactinopolyspora alba]
MLPDAGEVRMLTVVMHTSSPAEQTQGRGLVTVDVPLGPAVVPRLLPMVAAALGDGPAVLPLPRNEAGRDALLAELRPSEPVPDGTAFVVPTSGSTGRPKGVELPASSVRAGADATHERIGGPGRWLLAVPATHIAGLMVLARSVVAGTEPVALDLTGGFDPESFAAASMRLFTSRRRRYTALVPRQLGAVLDEGGAALDALGGYDAVLVGGGAATGELVDRARAAGVTVVTTYGMTETCGGCVYDGHPLDGVRVDVTDGRVRLRGPMLASGYRLRPDLDDVFAGGWFTTADLGHLDGLGRLVVTGRVDDVAVTGGENVPLAAVDLAVAGHPGVHEALSVARPDERWGQRIVTAVVPADPDQPPPLESVRSHVRREAPVAYAPKELIVVEALPHLPGGKPDRLALADQLGLADRHGPDPKAAR